MNIGVNLPNYSSLGYTDSIVAIARTAEALPYSDVLFSPQPSPRIPILVGGDSPAALKRAATLGDGWYGLWQSPDQVRESVAAINALRRREEFEVSVRVVTRIGTPIPDTDPQTSLQGDADAILYAVTDAPLIEKIGQYRAQGRLPDDAVAELVA